MTLRKRIGSLVAALSMLTLGAYVVPAVAQNSTPTVQECENAWSNGSASNSCGLEGVHDNLASISVNASGHELRQCQHQYDAQLHEPCRHKGRNGAAAQLRWGPQGR